MPFSVIVQPVVEPMDRFTALLKDSFTPLPGAEDRSPDLDCYWLGRAAMWGQLAVNTTLAWVARLQQARARCPAPALGPAPPRSCDAE